jgi:catalase
MAISTGVLQHNRPSADLSDWPDFLEQRLIEATQIGPVKWDMIVTIGQSGDPQDDPTQYWPKDRKEIKAGTLTISSASPQKGATCEKINFDPMVMADGIESTDDPILQFRSPAYAVSYSKRLNGE